MHNLRLVLALTIFPACGAQEPTMLRETREGAPASDPTPAAADALAAPPVATPPTVADDASVPAADAVADPVENPPVVADLPAAPVPEPVDDARHSKGQGGAVGLTEVKFKAANGLESSYKIMAPADAADGKAYGLHIHLHGDGGGGYADFPNRETRDGLIGVTVKAPNRALTWGRAAGKTHGEYVQELIQTELVKKYNVDLKRIYFSGVSGGAYFLAGSFLPAYGKTYRSGAFLMCGGESPRIAFDDAGFLKDFRVHWQVTAGERADIAASVGKAIKAYQDALAMVDGDPAAQTSEIKGAGGHCEFDGQDYTTGIQYMLDLKFDVVLSP